MRQLALRKIVQLLILAGILFTMLLYSAQALTYLPWLSRFSPLMTLVTRIAQRQWTPYFCGGVLITIICLFLPRLFCGWICPLGTCIDITDHITFASKRKNIIPASWRLAGFICLILVAMAGFGFETAGYLDPLTITGNSFAAFMDHNILTNIKLAFESKEFSSEIIMITIFVATLALTVFGRRTWCKTFCPLGGLLGMLGQIGIYKRDVNESCVYCGKCVTQCKMTAIDTDIKNTKHQSCISCYICVKVCPKKSISFSNS